MREVLATMLGFGIVLLFGGLMDAREWGRKKDVQRLSRMMAFAGVLFILAMASGCATSGHWYTQSSIDKAQVKAQAAGWVKSDVSPTMMGQPDPTRPGRVQMAYSPEQVAEFFYPIWYRFMRFLEYTTDGALVVGGGTLAVAGGNEVIKAVDGGGGGDTRGSGAITAGGDVFYAEEGNITVITETPAPVTQQGVP